MSGHSNGARAQPAYTPPAAARATVDAETSRETVQKTIGRVPEGAVKATDGKIA